MERLLATRHVNSFSGPHLPACPHTRCHQEATRKNERHQRGFVAAQRGTFSCREARRCGESDQDLGLRPCQDRGGREG